MQYNNKWLVLLAITAGIVFSACTKKQDTTKHESPAHVEQIEDSELSRVTLSQRAAERLGIKTTEITETHASALKKVVPYSAVLYDENGRTWVYTNPESLVYTRKPIVVDNIEDNLAYLSDGPPVGTKIVIVGAAELFGTEFKVGH